MLRNAYLRGAAALTTCLAAAPLFGQAQPSHAVRSQVDKSVVYTNRRYGFRFYLPANWTGYRIVEEPWSERSGAEIRIRNPRWTDDEPYEDIPVQVYTHKQWRDVERAEAGDELHQSSELGHNRRYVFALEPRWYYDFGDGWEEVQRIVEHGLKAFDP